MKEYKSYRILDKKPRWVIIDESGKITNRNPSKEELKYIEIELRTPYDTTKGGGRIYTDKGLLDILKNFPKENNGEIPTVRYFIDNPKYPSVSTYVKRFGSWSNALKKVGLDVESVVKRGIIETNEQKARFTEMIIRDHFKKNSIDLSGKNKLSPYDGICPNGMSYDVKCSVLHKGSYSFHTNNKYKEEIELYYFLAINGNYTKLEYGWRVPGEIVERNNFYVGMNQSPWSYSKFNVDNMKEYDITEILNEVLNKFYKR